MDAKLRRLLVRFADGETPRCSRKDFEALWALLPGLVQLESRYGADLTGGYVLTALKSNNDTTVAVQKFLTQQTN